MIATLTNSAVCGSFPVVSVSKANIGPAHQLDDFGPSTSAQGPQMASAPFTGPLWQITQTNWRQ
jgi:hypothetical protein